MLTGVSAVIIGTYRKRISPPWASGEVPWSNAGSSSAPSERASKKRRRTTNPNVRKRETSIAAPALDGALPARGESQRRSVDICRVLPRQFQQRGPRRERPLYVPGGHRAAIAALDGNGPRSAAADICLCSSVSGGLIGARKNARQIGSSAGAGASKFSFPAALLMGGSVPREKRGGLSYSEARAPVRRGPKAAPARPREGPAGRDGIDGMTTASRLVYSPLPHHEEMASEARPPT